MRYRITTPEPGHTGMVGMVSFVNGVAECDADDDSPSLYYFRSQGYGIEPLEPAAAEEPARPEPGAAAPKRRRAPRKATAPVDDAGATSTDGSEGAGGETEEDPT